MFSFLKKLTGSSFNASEFRSTTSASSTTRSKHSSAEETLASLGLDPSLLFGDIESNYVDSTEAGGDELPVDPGLEKELSKIHQTSAKANSKPLPSPAIMAGQVSNIDFDHINSLLNDDIDEDVEIHDHEVEELENELKELVEDLPPEELSMLQHETTGSGVNDSNEDDKKTSILNEKE